MQHCSCSLCSPSLTKSWKFAIFVHCSESTSRCYVKHCTTLYVRQVCTTAAACKEAINRHIYTPHIHTVYSSILSNISTSYMQKMKHDYEQTQTRLIPQCYHAKHVSSAKFGRRQKRKKWSAANRTAKKALCYSQEDTLTENEPQRQRDRKLGLSKESQGRSTRLRVHMHLNESITNRI